MSRKPIPAALKRRLMIEAGHRCAVPTCRATASLEYEHITDYAIVQNHEFDNMIVLCANCHGRKGTRQGQIDPKALRQYKANLAVLNSRYSDLERRVLHVFAEHRQNLQAALQGLPLADDWARGISVQLPGTMRILMMYLVDDKLVELAPVGTEYIAFLNGNTTTLTAMPPINGIVPDLEYYRLTPAGVDFLGAWLGARPFDGMEEADEDPE